MEEIFYNALCAIPDMSRRKLSELKQKRGSWEAAWKNDARSGVAPEAEWGELGKAGCGLVLLEDEKYPARLREIPDPPLGLYFLGNLGACSGQALAVVGTRKATSDGKETAGRFSRELAAAGIAIVSGLALGIDAAAHEGALAAGGKTAAILGSGLDDIYPKTNERLAKKILASGGAIISEYPLGSPPLPYRFLERNRIVSGLCRGALVVEAGEKSGALATAGFAAEQGRDLFVVPGPIGHPNYKGSNRLIREGAELVTSPGDILESLGVKARSATPENVEAALATKEEKSVFAALIKLAQPADVDKIMELTNLKPSEVNRALTMLVVKNAVKESGGGYAINKN